MSTIPCLPISTECPPMRLPFLVPAPTRARQSTQHVVYLLSSATVLRHGFYTDSVTTWLRDAPRSKKTTPAVTEHCRHTSERAEHREPGKASTPVVSAPHPAPHLALSAVAMSVGMVTMMNSVLA